MKTEISEKYSVKAIYCKVLLPLMFLGSYAAFAFDLYKTGGVTIYTVILAVIGIPIALKLYRFFSSSEYVLGSGDGALIEAGIKPVCDVLNSIDGVRTLWSCEGHPERPSRPYVSFEASREFAFKVHGLLDGRRAPGKLKYNWWLVAHFGDDGQLRYTIEPNDVRILKEQHFFVFSANQWSKSEMDAELLQLAELLKELKN